MLAENAGNLNILNDEILLSLSAVRKSSFLKTPHEDIRGLFRTKPFSKICTNICSQGTVNVSVIMGFFLLMMAMFPEIQVCTLYIFYANLGGGEVKKLSKNGTTGKERSVSQ